MLPGTQTNNTFQYVNTFRIVLVPVLINGGPALVPMRVPVTIQVPVTRKK